MRGNQIKMAATMAAMMSVSWAAPAQASYDDQFVCEVLGDVQPVIIISAEDSRKAKVQFTTSVDSGDGDTITTEMQQVISASGVRYEGEDISFHAKGNEGILTSGTLTTACRFAAEQSEPGDIGNIRAAMVGRWNGKLEYRDYQSDQWFPIPMQMTVEQLPDPMTFLALAAFDDGAGGFVRTSTMTMLANEGKTEYLTQFRAGRVPDVYANTLQVVTASDDTHWTIIATREGMDDDRPAMIKETSVRDGDTMTTLKEVHFIDNSDSDDWLVRNRITLIYSGAETE
ncbi:MAG: MliC family protein [Pseudomonadota bacterium]